MGSASASARDGAPWPHQGAPFAWVCGAETAPAPISSSDDVFSPELADPLAPWMARLDIAERGGHGGARRYAVCAGAAVAPNWVLTAGHCVGLGDWSEIEVVFGARDLGAEGAIRRRGVFAICPPDYQRGGLRGDVALLRLDAPLPANAPVLPVAGRDAAAGVRIGARARSAGWGGQMSSAGAGELRRADVVIVDAPGQQHDKIVAAPFDSRRSLCLGESGAPLVADLANGAAMIGVFSSVESIYDHSVGRRVELCDGFEARSHFTPTAPYRAWIDGAITACALNPTLCDSRRY